jgi:hypothetical protein
MNTRVAGALSLIVLVVCSAISFGGPLVHFIDFPSATLVVCVTVAGALLSFPASVTREALGSWSAGGALSEDQARQSHQVFQNMGRIAMAAGLLGTLIGLMQMLRQLDDPTQIGPAMAVAMLTLFYGVLLGVVLLRAMANECLARGGLGLPARSRTGSASVYLLMLATFVLLFCFAIMLVSMGQAPHSHECGEDVSSQQDAAEEPSGTEPVEAP